MRLASRIIEGQNLEEDICIWKYILDEEGKAEGRLERCDNGCDGTRVNCEYYLSQKEVKRYENK